MGCSQPSQFSASTVKATVRLEKEEGQLTPKQDCSQASHLLSLLQENKLFPLLKFPLAPPFFERQPFIQSFKKVFIQYLLHDQQDE